MTMQRIHLYLKITTGTLNEKQVILDIANLFGRTNKVRNKNGDVHIIPKNECALYRITFIVCIKIIV